MWFITFTRNESLFSSLVPYWIILSNKNKEEFMKEHQLVGDLCKHDKKGRIISRISLDTLNQIGIPISNGETKSILISNDITSIFLITTDGSLSNENKVKEMSALEIIISTKGGWKTVSYPFIKEKSLYHF